MMKQTWYIFLVLWLSFTLPSFAAPAATSVNETTTNTVSTSTIQQAIDDLPAKNLPENEATVAKSNLEQALQFAKNRDESESKIVSLKTQLAEAPAKSNTYRQQLEELTANPAKTIQDIEPKMSDAELQQRLSDNNTQITNWQIELTNANNTIQQLQTRPEQTQSQISTLQTRLQEIADQLKITQTDAVKLKLQAEQAAINAQINLINQELAGSSVLQDYSTSLRNLLTERINRLEQENLQLQNIINARRQAATEKTVQDLAQHQGNQTDTLLSKESETNLKLSEYLLKSNNRLNEISQLNQTTKQQLNKTQQIEETLKEQSLALKNSIALSRILYQQKQVLPTPVEDNNLANEIANLRIYQFQLNEQQEQFISPSNYVNRLLTNNTDVNDDLRQKLLELARTRQQLFSQLQYSLNSLTTEAINLQLTKQQLQKKVSQISDEIDEKMFWLPSNSTLGWNWLKQVPSRLKDELSSISWQQTLTDLGRGLVDRPWIFAPVVFFIILLLWKRRYLSARIESLNKEVGNVRYDSQLHTPLVILFNILLALPEALVLALGGIALLLDGQGMNIAYGKTLLELALGWMFFYTTYRLLSPNNVAMTHFNWNERQVATMRKQIVQIGALSLVLMSVVTIASQQLGNLANDVLGIIIVIICYLLMAFVIARTVFSKKARCYFNTIRWIMAIAIVSLPIILMIATIAGYYYTALRLTDRLIDTLYALLIWVVSEAVLVRGLSVAARRIAFQRALEKRKNKAETKEGEEEIIEEPVLDIQEINQQSLRLIRLGLFVVFGFTLYWIWSDVLAVFSYLDTITLYQYVGVDGATLVPLTLKAFIIAIVIAIVTVVLTRNLPGLLEVTVLSRLNLERGISYATTTLLTYIIIAVGFSLTLGLLGVSWNKLQWLVAALSVGLGFGLQEIFKNFVSGIILLFERPVRIGDRITVGGVTGTVNRIQIRATRVTDGDRKEVIIPNTTFATGQLINWTLTDTITRITLKIGVGYDSDIDRVKELLLQIAQNNSRVIQDPGPSVSFVNFGADTLDLELTMLVNEIADRGAATDEINRQILTLFRAENIDIPYHQVDVTLKNSEGKELTLTEPATKKETIEQS